jgi:hypothetical protein
MASVTDERALPCRNGQACAHVRSLWCGNRRAAARRHVRPPWRPLRARLRHLKRRARGAQLQPRLWAFNGLVPYQVSMTLARPEPRARKIKPSKGTITNQWPRDPLSESGRHRCPRFQRTTDQQLEGRPDRKPMSPTDIKKTGHLAATPQRPYWSGVRSLTLEGFEQAPQINRVRDDEGARIRAYPTHVSAFTNESPDHEPTLIEWGMGVHLNHPIIAQRGTHNSRPARWELRRPHPSSRGETARERTKQVEELAPIASNGPRLGGSTHGHTPWDAPNADNAKYVCVAPPMPAGTNTPHTGRLCEKTLQEHPRSCKASGARPAIPLVRPHGIALATRGKKVPSASVSICGILTDTPTNARGQLSSHKGPLNNQGKPAYSRKKQRRKRT